MITISIPYNTFHFWSSTGGDWNILYSQSESTIDPGSPGSASGFDTTNSRNGATYYISRCTMEYDLSSIDPNLTLLWAYFSPHYLWYINANTGTGASRHEPTGCVYTIDPTNNFSDVPYTKAGYGVLKNKILVGATWHILPDTDYTYSYPPSSNVKFTASGMAYIEQHFGGMVRFGSRMSDELVGYSPSTTGTIDYQMTRTHMYNDGPDGQLVLVVGESALRGMFVRGNNIQVVGSLQYGINGKRSPDFGTTWYNFNELPINVYDVAFDAEDDTNSIIGCSGAIYLYSGGTTEYTYKVGPAVLGDVTDIDVDLNSNIAVIGTTQAVYKTIDWGANVYKWSSYPADGGVAIGGTSISGVI